MTSDAHATVTPLRCPPVRQSTLVRSDVGHTFDTFVRTIGAWWPLQPLSNGKERVRDVVVEQRHGGRVYETWEDGTVVGWGAITAWDPPRTFAMSWDLTAATTEVALTFSALGPALTRVSVEHRGWETLTEEQIAEECRMPGETYLESYGTGWSLVLARFKAAVEEPEADASTR